MPNSTLTPPSNLVDLKIGPLNNEVLLALNTIVISLVDGREPMKEALKARSANSLLSLQFDDSVLPSEMYARVDEAVKRDIDAYKYYLRTIDNLMSLLVALVRIRELGDTQWFLSPQFEKNTTSKE